MRPNLMRAKGRDVAISAMSDEMCDGPMANFYDGSSTKVCHRPVSSGRHAAV